MSDAPIPQQATLAHDGGQGDAGGVGGLDRKAFAGKRCFVVMPYGKRVDPVHPTEPEIDFDAFYDMAIKPAVEALGLECLRADKTSRSGLIHREMIEAIMESDAVIVDITLLNPNVFYELGIRHAARRSGTVVIRSVKQAAIPFNISGLRVFDYDPAPLALNATQRSISATLANSLADQAVDSLVYQLTASTLSIKRIGKPIGWRERIDYSHGAIKSKRLAIITGDICHVKGVDVWVNPENTRMEMGRVHDNSLSASMRYLGGRRDVNQRVTTDHIQDELDARLARRKNTPKSSPSRHTFRQVEAGGVIATGSGRLVRSHATTAILHVAAMTGEPTKGYQLIRNYSHCVTNALLEMDRLNQATFDRYRLNPFRGKLKSILFPLLGTRETRLDPHDVAYGLVLAATNYLEDHPESTIETVYFLAYTDVDLSLAEQAFRRNDWTKI